MDTCMDTNNNSKDLGDLESLVKMYKEGFLTDEEFKRAKAKILGDSDTKEDTENVTEDLEKGKPESSDNSQENAATESSEAETPLEHAPSEKTSSEKNINTEISDKETKKTASSNTEVKKKKNYKKMYWGIGIVAVLALSVCAYLAYLYPTKNELLCFLNQGDKCYAAGLDYQKGTDAIKKDENKAIKYLEKGCELNNAKSCENLVFYFNEENEKRNLAKAFKFSKKACQLDNVKGCFIIGLMYSTGTGATLDLNKANEYIDKSCRLSPSFCTKIAKDTLEENKSPKESKLTEFKKDDYALEYLLLEKACKYQDGKGCFEIALNFFSKNPEKYIEWISKGCDLKDDLSCLGLNVLFKYTNPYKALEAVKKGCKNEGEFSCSILADYYKKGIYIEKNIDKAFSLYQKSCDSNIAFACTNLAELLENKHDKNKANNIIDILQKACDLEDGAGCIFLGFMNERGLETTKDTNKAQELYTKGNTLNANSCIFNDDARACLFLGLSYKKGYGFEINNKLASTWYDKACSLNNDYACTFLGELYQYGKGVKKDKNKANDYFFKGCILGDPDGCAQANIDNKNR